MRATGRETDRGRRALRGGRRRGAARADDAARRGLPGGRPADRERARVGRDVGGDPRVEHRRWDRGHAPHRVRSRAVAGARARARAAWPSRERCSGRRGAARAAAGAWRGVGAMVLVVAPSWRSRRATSWPRLLAEQRGGTLVFYAEDTGGTVAVLEQERRAGASVGSTSRASRTPATRLTSKRYMRLQALLPLLIHRGEPRRALVVGFGTGITAGALLADPGLKTRVVAELLPSVVRAAASSRATWVRRRIPGSTSASATAGRSCCAAPNATTSSRSSRRRRPRPAS